MRRLPGTGLEAMRRPWAPTPTESWLGDSPLVATFAAHRPRRTTSAGSPLLLRLRNSIALVPRLRRITTGLRCPSSRSEQHVTPSATALLSTVTSGQMLGSSTSTVARTACGPNSQQASHFLTSATCCVDTPRPIGLQASTQRRFSSTGLTTTTSRMQNQQRWQRCSTYTTSGTSSSAWLGSTTGLCRATIQCGRLQSPTLLAARPSSSRVISEAPDPTRSRCDDTWHRSADEGVGFSCARSERNRALLKSARQVVVRRSPPRSPVASGPGVEPQPHTRRLGEVGVELSTVNPSCRYATLPVAARRARSRSRTTCSDGRSTTRCRGRLARLSSQPTTSSPKRLSCTTQVKPASAYSSATTRLNR